MGKMPKKGHGHIRLVADQDKCLNVPRADARNGNWLQIWDCDALSGTRLQYDMDFMVVPVYAEDSSTAAFFDCVVGNKPYKSLFTQPTVLADFEAAIKDSVA